RINTGDDAYSKELTNFTLIPTLLINEQTKQEEYIVDVKFEGQIYRNRRISIANLNSPNTLKIALGIMGLVVTATTYEYSVLQMAFRKLVRQEIRASDILGLHDSCFLIPNGVITKEGLTKGKMILIDKKGDSHSASYDVPLTDEHRWKITTQLLLQQVVLINNREKMLLIVGWFLASVLKEYLFRQHNYKFPVLQVYGTKGSGKTSTITALLDYFGHKDPKALPSDRAFPVLKHLSMTNALAVFLDEYRESLHNSG